ncbi:ankyrin repeat, SAM and basic leucine zipper domain-containing protein 1 [Anopheles aquasalis]|uniref:ankyrin repeat, SAM and basic leucine zipper domain-containing protein 1 n=1 Tax=Anopheles aquasalis TaxID=42839 RepID=UPI00215A7846|nr:ankyrin repeat, SAM and basic leucine zipper domain-containing protein 1 [Anopheles aquasalis]
MYRPAGYDDSDEDDEYDEFGFYSECPRPTPAVPRAPPVNYELLLNNAVCDGNLEETKRILDLDRSLRSGGLVAQGWPIIFSACYEAHRDIVEYLLVVEKVDANQMIGMETALMKACASPKPTELVYPVVRLLLDFGAIIEVLDRFGCTPLMFACQQGHLKVVKEIVGESPLITVDRDGNTALFLAVINNHYEIVKGLLRAGAQPNIVNRAGFTPRQCAILAGHTEVAELFPAEEEPYLVAAKYRNYSNYKDLIDSGHHSNIDGLLFGMNSEDMLHFFAKKDVDLFDFLTMTDDRLREVGIKYPIQRKRILLGLYDLHQHPWSKGSLNVQQTASTIDMYDTLEMLANIHKQMIVLHSTLVYTKELIERSQNPQAFDDVMEASNLQRVLRALQSTMRGFQAQLLVHHKLSAPKPILHITSEPKLPIKSKKPLKVCAFLGLLGCVVYLKFRK